MPMPTDEVLVAQADEVKNLLIGAFNTPPGYRPAHAKGTVLTGTWTPTTPPSPLTKAWHIQTPTTVLARFSNNTGIPTIPDTDPNATPKGLALRFNYPPAAADGKRKHTDIVAHSTPHFPARTGAEFARFLKALGEGAAAVDAFLGTHPHTLEFVQAAKPLPVSFGTEAFFGLNAFKFVAGDGVETYVRYEFVPVAGVAHLSDEQARGKGADYLAEEIRERIGRGPVGIKLIVQVAEEGDVVDDITVHWPAERAKVELGTVWLDAVDEEGLETQKKTIFDPIPRVEGIEASADPILDFRAALYLISGRERRAA